MSDVSNLLIPVLERRVFFQNVSASFGEKTPNMQTHLPKTFLPSRKHYVGESQYIWQMLQSPTAIGDKISPLFTL